MITFEDAVNNYYHKYYRKLKDLDKEKLSDVLYELSIENNKESLEYKDQETFDILISKKLNKLKNSDYKIKEQFNAYTKGLAENNIFKFDFEVKDILESINIKVILHFYPPELLSVLLLRILTNIPPSYFYTYYNINEVGNARYIQLHNYYRKYNPDRSKVYTKRIDPLNIPKHKNMETVKEITNEKMLDLIISGQEKDIKALYNILQPLNIYEELTTIVNIDKKKKAYLKGIAIKGVYRRVKISINIYENGKISTSGFSALLKMKPTHYGSYNENSKSVISDVELRNKIIRKVYGHFDFLTNTFE